MSHDRGCPCGRERYDYDTCPNEDCYKRTDIMEDTDWRPSPCPLCGEMRSAGKNPKCDNPHCSTDTKRTPMMTMKTKTEPKQYVWIHRGGTIMLVEDLVKLFKDENFDPVNDTIYELGAEVKLELNVKVTPAKPTYRERGYAEGTR